MQIFNVWEYKVWIVQQQTKRGNALVIITLYLKMQSPIENNDINAVVEVESQQRSLEIEAMIQQLDQECVQELLPKQQALQNAIQYLQQQQNQYQLLQQQQTPHTTHDTVLLQQFPPTASTASRKRPLQSHQEVAAARLAQALFQMDSTTSSDDDDEEEDDGDGDDEL